MDNFDLVKESAKISQLADRALTTEKGSDKDALVQEFRKLTDDQIEQVKQQLNQKHADDYNKFTDGIMLITNVFNADEVSHDPTMLVKKTGGPDGPHNVDLSVQEGINSVERTLDMPDFRNSK